MQIVQVIKRNITLFSNYSLGRFSKHMVLKEQASYAYLLAILISLSLKVCEASVNLLRLAY